MRRRSLQILATAAVKNVLFVILLTRILATNLFGTEINADDPVKYDPTSGNLVATSNAKLIAGKAGIRADKMEYSAGSKTAMAQGNVNFANSNVFILADSLVCDLGSKPTITVSDGSIYVAPITVDSARLHIEKRYQKLENCTLYVGQPGPFAASISAKNLEIVNLKKVRARSVTFKVLSVPIFYLPKCSFPLAEHPFWLKHSQGLQDSLGLYSRNDFYFRASESVRIGGALDVYTKRGLLFGPALEVKKNTNSAKIFGESKFGFIRDCGDFSRRNPRPSEYKVNRNRFFLETNEIVHMGERVDEVASVNWLSDPDMIRNFRPSWYEKNQIADSFADVTYRGNNYTLSAFTRVRLNNFHDTITRTPELHADILPQRLGDTNVYGMAYVGYTHLKGKDKHGQRRELDKIDGYCGAYVPIFHGNWLSITPLAGVRATEYLPHSGIGHHGRAIAQFGFDVETTFSGRSNFTNETWNIHGIKHIIQLVAQYRYISRARIKSELVPAIETCTFDTNLPIIDLSDMRNVDDISTQNLLRIGLKNLLQTSTGGYLPRDLLRLDIYQDIRLHGNTDIILDSGQKIPANNAYILFALHPANWLDFDCYARINTKRATLNEINTSTSLRDGDVWKVSFLTRTLQHDTCQYGIKFTAKPNSRIQFATASHYDARTKKFTEQRFSISSTLARSWHGECALRIRNKASSENKYQFFIKLRLAEF
jgi:LPS-assembly protein